MGALINELYEMAPVPARPTSMAEVYMMTLASSRWRACPHALALDDFDIG